MGRGAEDCIPGDEEPAGASPTPGPLRPGHAGRISILQGEQAGTEKGTLDANLDAGEAVATVGNGSV